MHRQLVCMLPKAKQRENGAVIPGNRDTDELTATGYYIPVLHVLINCERDRLSVLSHKMDLTGSFFRSRFTLQNHRGGYTASLVSLRYLSARVYK